MGEFRIGRAYAKHSYPESRQNTTVPLARNFAVGPATTTAVTTGGTPVPWSSIESGAPAGVNVPLTPLSSGIIELTGVIEVDNGTESPVVVQVQTALSGPILGLPVNEKVTVQPGFAAIPIVTEWLAALPLGTTVDFQVIVTAASNGAITLVAGSSSFRVKEVPPATG
jgi:hypothetical protein